jgi:hypothetical protein
MDVDKILAERGGRYGSFYTQGLITQDLKRMIRRYANEVDTKMAPDQWEALDMICSKISRIVNGDPDYDDSWVDIAGYAQLIARRLQEEQRKFKTVEEQMREAADRC